MLTIKGSAETEIVIKKSRFLGLACRAESEEEAQRVLEQRRKQHYNARHHCYAYSLATGVMRCSDDGEPQGTAGVPMLEVLGRMGLTDVVVVSTRYFGGTLLGAGGLVRAYSQSAADTLAAARKVKRMECGVFRCKFEFPTWARVQSALASQGFTPCDIQYTDTISAEYCVLPDGGDAFIQAVIHLTQGRVSPENLGLRVVEQDA